MVTKKYLNCSNTSFLVQMSAFKTEAITRIRSTHRPQESTTTGPSIWLCTTIMEVL